MKTIKSDIELLKKEVIIQWKVWKKDLFLLANKLIEKVTNSRNAKELYQSLIRKNTKPVKQSKVIIHQPKIWKLKHYWYKSVITEHPKLHINYPRL